GRSQKPPWRMAPPGVSPSGPWPPATTRRRPTPNLRLSRGTPWVSTCRCRDQGAAGRGARRTKPMSADKPDIADEQFASLVAACDEALAAGSAAAAINPEVPEELRERLERGVACMRLLRQALPHPTPTTPSGAAALPALSRL